MATDFLRMVQGVQKRDVILEAEVHYVDKMRQEAQVRVVSPPSRTYILQCDEGHHMGGDDELPPPLAFFMAGILF
jgi:hypothetical protein